MRTQICLIEKGHIVYGNGFPSVNKNTNGWKIQTIHNRTTTWLVWMQNYSSLSSSSSSPPSRFPPCCFRRAYTSHRKHTPIALYTSLIAISSLVFLNRVSSGNHGWKKEDSTTLSTTPSTTLATLESLMSGFLLLLNPFLLKVPVLDFHHHQIFLSDKP